MIRTRDVRTLIQIFKQTLALASSLPGHDYVAPPCFHSSPERTHTCTWIISWHYSSAVIHHVCSKTTKFHIPELFSKHHSDNKPLNWKHSCQFVFLDSRRSSINTLKRGGWESVFSVCNLDSLCLQILQTGRFNGYNPILLSRSSVWRIPAVPRRGGVTYVPLQPLWPPLKAQIKQP